MMTHKWILLTGALALSVLVLAACAGAPAPTNTPTAVTSSPTVTLPSSGTSLAASDVAPGPAVAYEAQHNAGGSVTVDVQPTALNLGAPVAFDIAMNTHSVDLSDDMTKISALRDDTGKEYKPSSWDGAEAGRHHRSGTLLFPALTGKPRYVELVVKGLAKVPERVFRWDLP